VACGRCALRCAATCPPPPTFLLPTSLLASSPGAIVVYQILTGNEAGLIVRGAAAVAVAPACEPACMCGCVLWC
jgi:hypothetical protein